MRVAERIGLVGLGLMGSALAQRLHRAGFRVVGYDLDAGRTSAFAAAGGEPVAGPGAVFAACARVVLSLPTSAVVRQVMEEVAPGLRPGQCVIDTTTGDPEASRVLAEGLAAIGVGYLDATVSGSSEQTRRGEVTVMVGGPADQVARARDVLECVSAGFFHVGPWGDGARMKLVTNLVLGLNRAALAEGLAFAGALGLEPARALEVLGGTMAYSRIMDTKGDKMVRGDFSVQGKLSQHLKDLVLILDRARTPDLPLPLTEAHRGLLEAVRDAGHGEADNSAVILAYRCSGGRAVTRAPGRAQRRCAPTPGRT